MKKVKPKVINPQVVVYVENGFASISYASPGVEVAIIDADVLRRSGKSPEHSDRYWVWRAKKDEARA